MAADSGIPLLCFPHAVGPERLHSSLGIMSESTIIATKRHRSFSSTAAWISLITPLATFGIVASLLSVSGHTSLLPPPSRQFSGDLHGWSVLIDFGSLVLGIFSFFGIRRHGAAFILWKAVPGVFLSGGFGFYHFVLTMMSSIVC